MNRRTVEQLIEINREFYRSRAVEFDVSRRSPWPGWQRVLELMGARHEVSILDVGCGNGRFGLFAEQILEGRLSYCGVDSSAELLAAARSRGPDGWRLLERDILRQPLPEDPAGQGFDLVSCFGVMHHVPGEPQRRALLERMTARLGPGGRLALSFWQFGDDDRFRRRVLPWEDLARVGLGEVDPSELERDDYLLRWGGVEEGPPALRYCHHCGPAEVTRLIDQIAVEPIEIFRADGGSGELNLYCLLGRPD